MSTTLLIDFNLDTRGFKTLTVKIKLTDNRVLVYQAQPEEEKTTGGIVIPAGSEVTQKGQALVVGAGPGRLLEDGTRLPMACEEGDTVVLSRFGGGEPYEEEGVMYMIIRDSDVLGVL